MGIFRLKMMELNESDINETLTLVKLLKLVNLRNFRLVTKKEFFKESIFRLEPLDGIFLGLAMVALVKEHLQP